MQYRDSPEAIARELQQMKCPLTVETLNRAIEHQYDDVAVVMLKRGCKWNSQSLSLAIYHDCTSTALELVTKIPDTALTAELLNSALNQGHQKLANILVARRCPRNNKTLEIAVQRLGGSEQLISNLMNGSVITSTALECAITNCYHDTIRSMIPRAKVFTEQMLSNALLRQTPEDIVLSLVSKGCPLPHNIISRTIARKCAETTKLLLTNPNCFIDEYALISVFEYGVDDTTFEQLVNHPNIVLSAQTLTTAIYVRASILRIRQLIDRKCSMSEDAFAQAIARQRGDVLDILVEKGCPAPPNAILDVLKIDRSIAHVMLHAGYQCSADALEYAIMRKLDDTIDLMLGKNCLMSARALELAIGHSTELTLWLISKGCTALPWALDRAIARGQLEVVRALIAHGCAVLPRHGDSAAKSSNREIRHIIAETLGVHAAPHVAPSNEGFVHIDTYFSDDESEESIDPFESFDDTSINMLFSE